MANTTLHYEKLGACEICGNCVEKKHPWYYCLNDNGDFGDVSYPEDCNDFIHLEGVVEDEEPIEDDFNPTKPIECPDCGSDAYWTGACYECEDCGWCGDATM